LGQAVERGLPVADPPGGVSSPFEVIDDDGGNGVVVINNHYLSHGPHRREEPVAAADVAGGVIAR
jgi:hypothetical protein